MKIEKVQNYISKRLTELSLMLANYEDDLDNYPIDECEGRKENLKLAVEIGRARIDELRRIKMILESK